MMGNGIFENIDTAIKKVWLEDLKIDYANNFLLKEDSLKNAFYFHLRNRLGEDFLKNNNLRIFTEYYINGERIDLAIVEIDSIAVEDYHLKDCVIRVLAAVEMKYKGASVSDDVFYEDVNKILSFINSWGNDTKHYLAFIQEKYFKTEDVGNWLEDEQASNAKGKVSELYAYWDQDSDETVWSVIDH
ncbi:hypothetical protein BWGOE3_08900 [Bacillus mycoides]|nr:hypothetical protein IEM_04364 [Bacillus cereus BAG6O-2]OFD40541.1 hypothetical protein BWGOE2_32680 [Bacillus mycoides]OFD49648.1 hypothetical protein BWGOE1_09320 [Bacillus mycoides]OFD51885.1 hypothetical protein BWGOE3_08900 [Bacillus mycoides]OFD64510.1 hypothetical protein BWGOE6_09370 [Bacillus mycoides]